MTSALAQGAITAYRSCGRLISPAAGFLLEARAKRGKEDRARRDERFGRASAVRPDGSLVWVHAASVGETMSVLPIVRWLTRGGHSVVLTTGTVTSATIAATRLPKGAVHQYVPLDLAPYVARFLDHWRPQLALFVESEIWPATVIELDRRGVPQILVNGRLSERSARRWQRVGSLARALFGRLTMVIAQSALDAERFQRLGAGRIEAVGNIKLDCEPLSADAAELEQLRAMIGARPVFLAASTHQGEEAIVAEATSRLAAQLPELLTIIVPRHPNRRDDIVGELARLRIEPAVRSRGDPIGPETRLYLADTLGELGLFYRLASVALVGGSLVPIGGHNPIEAAQLDCAILHGPHIANAADIFAALDGAGAARPVADADELAAAVADLVSDGQAAGRMAALGAALIEQSRGALEKTERLIEPQLGTSVGPTSDREAR
ncbi:MAG: 3-deoxy-D-manno-octulosonic acid transferase [Ancalomicrobiaceae bacterium]|nr:3-deoxy-D-manno-octulosonic acid transferase [Ancalomicrobiaceae bacterium]